MTIFTGWLADVVRRHAKDADIRGHRANAQVGSPTCRDFSCRCTKGAPAEWCVAWCTIRTREVGGSRNSRAARTDGAGALTFREMQLIVDAIITIRNLRHQYAANKERQL